MLFRALRALALVIVVALTGALFAPPGYATGATVALGPVPVSPGLQADLAALPSETRYGAFVHLAAPSPDGGRSQLADYGLKVITTLDTVNVAFAAGTLSDFRALTHSPAVTYLEKNEQLAFADETDGWATRARVAQQAVAGGPYRDAGNRVIDGTGVGVAIIDSGVDSAHPDLARRIVKNYKVECSLVLVYTDNGRCYPDPVELEPGVPSDTTSGHGTHVAGIVAGDGTASNGTFLGAAPGASLFTFGVGEGINVLFASQAYDYLVQEYDSFSPRIRVVNNSYGNKAGTKFDPNSVLSKLVVSANDLGMTSVFAAGNDGTNADKGDADDLSGYAKDPTPGVVTVANYSDAERGTRDNTLDTSSSRGKKGFAQDYPDISAPGSSITSTCSHRLPLCALGPNPAYQPHYAYMSGTSMAAPNIAGIAAMLYQARPDLTTAQLEDVLQDTAHKYTGGTGAPGAYEADAQNPGSTTSYDKGAGLVDVPAALNALAVAHDGAVVAPVPTLSITSPADGDQADGIVAISGHAFDGVVQPTSPAAVLVASGDGGDYPGPGAADIVSLTAAEEATGMAYAIQVRNLADLGVTTVGLRVTQKLDGSSFLTSVNVTSAGATIPAAGSSNTAVATTASADRSTNTVRFFVPFANLGKPSAGAPVYNVFASSFTGAIADVAPGGTGAEAIARPRFGRDMAILRPQPVVPPAASVTLSVDGGPEVPATLTGSSPDYGFVGTVDLSSLPEGAHTITAALRLGETVVAADTVQVLIERLVTYDISITGPRDGDTVMLAATDITGTAKPSKPTTAVQSVTVRVHGNGYDSGEQPVEGLASWARSFDFGVLLGGSYTVTANYLADGAVVDTAAVTVSVPTPTIGSQVSYAPQGLGWWRGQYDGATMKSGHLTTPEADRVSERAAQLSARYFSSSETVKTALLASGSLSTEKRTARQLAVLLLNRAAGDLSRSMSVPVGLSGAEGLDPRTYDTAGVGRTVDHARAWVRTQLPGGDLGGANQVAASINEGIGLL